MVLANVGEAGQRRLLASHAVVVGVGALGCVSADLLARAGVGRLTLIDRDLFRFEEIWAAAGHPNGVFRLRPQDLPGLTGGAPVADVVQVPA
jgi:glycine/D-amino acid oxidase-like deaminating enzyme